MKHLFFTFIFWFVINVCALHAEEIIVPTDNYPPWKIAEEGTVTGGIDIVLIESLLEDLDVSPQYIACPWKRCLLMLEQGTGDLISGVTLNKQRQEYLIYLTPPYKTISQKVLYVGREQGSSYNTLADLEQKNIGILRGARYFPSFDQNPAIFKIEVESDFQGMKMLAAGRIDGFIITKENGEYELQNHPELERHLELASWRYDKSVEVYLAISKESGLVARKKELETRLQHLVESGKVNAIMHDFLQ